MMTEIPNGKALINVFGICCELTLYLCENHKICDKNALIYHKICGLIFLR